MTQLLTTDQLKKNPTPELKALLDVAVEHSRASQSTVRKDFICRDGTLVVTSHNGAPVAYTVEPPADVELPGE